MCVCVCVSMYVSIERGRERKRERSNNVRKYTSFCVTISSVYHVELNDNLKLLVVEEHLSHFPLISAFHLLVHIKIYTEKCITVTK